MKIKKSLLLFIVILLPVLSLAISCNGNTDEAAQADSPPASNFFLELGYENCLMCHMGKDKNNSKNLTPHCLHFDPEAYMRINDEGYSPTISDCLLCHTSHLEEGRRTFFECGKCHFG